MGYRRGFIAAVWIVSACGSDDPPGRTFYEREIEPILIGSCAGNTGGCHKVEDGDEFGFAAGNFDVTSFENVQRRRDLLRPYGAYNTPLLLVKAVGNTGELGITYDGEFRPLEVNHVGGGIFGVGSDAYLTLLEWTDNGATENGLLPPAQANEGQGDCSTFVPDDFDDGPIQDEGSLGAFATDVQPILQACAAGSCHGAPQADFYITCGDSSRQVAFNFSQARAFVDDPVDNSQILQVPLESGGSGRIHGGGVHWEDRDDGDYQTIADWAEDAGPVDFGAGDAGKEFFAANVQPLLLTRGCSFQACHSPSATNDFQLRSGSQGFFSAIALERNYKKLREGFMALEVPDARRGRAVAKTILESFGGIAHRGGPVLETPGSGGALPANCDASFDPATASAYCAVQEWVNIERQPLIDAGEVRSLAEGTTVPVVYVARDPGDLATPLEFDDYQPGADLRVSQATLGAEGAIDDIPAGTTILTSCPGVGDGSTVDVRGPDVRRDGNTVAFAMRTSASEPLQIYTVELDTLDCAAVTEDEGEVDGILIHKFDPAWSPDGQWIVYASTRGADPGDSPSPGLSRRLFLPQSDLWRVHADGSGTERMTFLTNSEVSPQFMREGRVIMTTEKVSEDFYQLSGRRMNWDLTDYHPLLAQRAASPFADDDDPDATRPSVDYQQATELREGFDGNFLLVLSDPGTRGGAGALAIFNRSVGTFEADRDDPGFLVSLVRPDRRATGRAGQDTDGAYRSPFPLPDGRILASYAAYEGDLADAGALEFALVAVNPRSGARATLLAEPGEALVEAVLALKAPARDLYINRRQLVFGGRADTDASGGDGFAVMHFPDAPLIFTLLNANLRRGRPVDLFRGASRLAIYQEQPAGPDGNANLGDIFQERDLLGTVDLADDGSAKVRVPSGVGIIMELQDGSGEPVVTMREEHQLGPGENITFGIAQPLFDAVCGGCHGTVSGREIDVFVTPDALTGASRSLSQDETARDLD
jgi:hypothetical protein